MKALIKKSVAHIETTDGSKIEIHCPFPDGPLLENEGALAYVVDAAYCDGRDVLRHIQELVFESGVWRC